MDLLQILEKSKKTFLLLYRPNCPYCREFLESGVWEPLKNVLATFETAAEMFDVSSVTETPETYFSKIPVFIFEQQKGNKNWQKQQQQQQQQKGQKNVTTFWEIVSAQQTQPERFTVPTLVWIEREKEKEKGTIKRFAEKMMAFSAKERTMFHICTFLSKFLGRDFMPVHVITGLNRNEQTLHPKVCLFVPLLRENNQEEEQYNKERLCVIKAFARTPPKTEKEAQQNPWSALAASVQFCENVGECKIEKQFFASKNEIKSASPVVLMLEFLQSKEFSEETLMMAIRPAHHLF